MKQFILISLLGCLLSCSTTEVDLKKAALDEPTGFITLKIEGESLALLSLQLHLPSEPSNCFAFRGEFPAGYLEIKAFDQTDEGSDIVLDLNARQHLSATLKYKGEYYIAGYRGDVIHGAGFLYIEELSETAAKGIFEMDLVTLSGKRISITEGEYYLRKYIQ